MTVDIIVMLIIVLLVVAAIMYIRGEKKRGVTCIGCPHAAECAKKKQGGCGTDTK
ncbi:MAG: FeoB-associated Cys-rich membrane protein [Lachnospiraceae bacterium]|nr:FeoB-associated Cys-rich membrane protein [Lachnospiraceae bacterium]MEE1015957.1 FeoB-associated Cys-rich membrane protein [Lachnospiraceae bacterium]